MPKLFKPAWIAGLVAGLLAPVIAAAQTSPFAAGVNLGTPGVGGELQFQVAPSLVIRGDGDWLRFHRNETWSDIPYRGRLKVATAGIFADWHPAGGAFLLSGGGYFGQRRIDLRSRPTGDVVVGGQTFTSAQVGRIEGRAKLSTAQPFVGLGWDNTFTNGGGWGVRALLGVSFSSSPRVSLTSVGGAFSNDPIVLAALRREEADVRHDARNWKYYPVAQVGVTHRF